MLLIWKGLDIQLVKFRTS